MKKILMACIMALTLQPLAASDYTYKYLVLTSASGEQTTVSTENLKITFVDGKLVATNDNGSTELSVTSLSKMFFSESDGVSTAINTVSSKTQTDASCEVYTLSGVRLGSYQSLSEARSRLAHGLYIVRQSGKNIKITVK